MPSPFSPFRSNEHNGHTGHNSRKLRTIYPMIVIPLLALVLIAGTLYLQNFVHAAPTTKLVPFSGTVPQVVAHSKLNSQANPNQAISLAIGLRLRNEDMLTKYIDDISRPKSVNYHRYLTQAQIEGAFSPTQATHDAILQYLKNSGFTITHTYKHRMLIDFRGSIGLAERVFHVTINNYTAPNGQIFYSNTTDPLLPSTLIGQVESLSGLNDFAHLHHPPLHIQAASTHTTHNTTKAASPSVSCLGPGTNYFLPSQIAAGYNLNGLYNAGYHGEGQTVALFELATFQSNDISAYRSCYDQGSPTVMQTILVDGGPLPPDPNGDGGPAEVELDAELVLSAAPKLSLLKIYDAPNTVTGDVDQWAQIVQDAPPVVSTSWGECEANADSTEVQQEHSLFAIAVAQGQSIFAASSDSGSSGCFFDNANQNKLNVIDPASQPYITGIGGTKLVLNSDNSYNSESVWNNQPQNSSQPQGGASGGGFSTNWPKPSWQNAPGVSSQNNRQIPDVALNADPFNQIDGGKGYLIYCTETISGCSSTQPWGDFGGTSCGAPMWAAMMALTNEESVKTGGFNIGFVNPLLYQIASGNRYSSDFHDITVGNNDYNALQGGKYPAGNVYDLATGLGSYNAANLATDLVALAKSNSGSRLAPANTTWYFAEGSVGGGFQEYLTLQNPDTTQTANVTITYLLQNHTPATKVVTYQILPSSRQTVNVNTDLQTHVSDPQISVAAIVQVTNEPSGPGIVAERPMYFSFQGIQSGTDVVGATAPGQTYYFSEGSSVQASPANYSTYVSILNPSNSSTANVTITYYTGSCTASTCPTEKLQVPPLARATGNPAAQGLHTKLAIRVNSDQPIVVERPMYFKDNIPNAGGTTLGAASQVGATASGMDWLFAEGYTGTNFQEYFELANFGSSQASVNIKLEYGDGSTQTHTVPVPAFGLLQFDVNAQSGATPEVSAEITSDNPIVADRLMYFHEGSSHFSGGTDVVGAPAAHNVYAFAEGYTGGAFSEYLTLQNPTGQAETVSVTFFTESGLVFQEQVQVLAHSRKTIPVSSIINAFAKDTATKEVSMTVQALSGTIVAERPMYFGYYYDQGGTDVIGYTGG